MRDSSKSCTLHGYPLPTPYHATTVLELVILDLSQKSVVQYQHWNDEGPCHYSAAHSVTLTACGVINALSGRWKDGDPAFRPALKLPTCSAEVAIRMSFYRQPPLIHNS